MTTDPPSRDLDLLDSERSVLPFEVVEADPRGKGMGRRLVIAFVLSCMIAAGCWIVLPRFGVWVPVWVPLAGFVLIVIATVAASRPGDDRDDNDTGGGCDEGRPICCSGPRPLRMFKE
ncbi:MAG: hypothetical protein KF902_06860 [Phycisphaeraceae bacterium]|nr:hypothetical protein [Phycisphaeraceae bacterium]